MFDIKDPEAFWLNVTNFGLGLLCVVCFFLVVGSVVHELVARRRRVLGEVLQLDSHALRLPELGLTMADGGEPLEKEAQEKQEVAEQPSSAAGPQRHRWLFWRRS